MTTFNFLSGEAACWLFGVGFVLELGTIVTDGVSFIELVGALGLLLILLSCQLVFFHIGHRFPYIVW